jgi:hypothetical protein
MLGRICILPTSQGEHEVRPFRCQEIAESGKKEKGSRAATLLAVAGLMDPEPPAIGVGARPAGGDTPEFPGVPGGSWERLFRGRWGRLALL